MIKANIGQEANESAFKPICEDCRRSQKNVKNDFAKRVNGGTISSTSGKKYKRLINPDMLEGLDDKEIYYFKEKERDTIFVFPSLTAEGKVDDKGDITKYAYNDLNVKSNFTNKKNDCSDCDFFKYGYCCNKSKLGNGDFNSNDGNIFRGRGFIQLTGRDNYRRNFYTPWKANHPDEKRTIEQMAPLISSDSDVSVEVAMIFWNHKKINNEINDEDYNKADCKNVTLKINGGDNGLSDREIKTKIILFVILITFPCFYIRGQKTEVEKYTYSDVEGIWVYSDRNYTTDCKIVYYNNFFIFKDCNLLFIPTAIAPCNAWDSFFTTKYGFSNEWLEIDTDTLYSHGYNLVYIDKDYRFNLWHKFEINPQEWMFFYNAEWDYIETLPQRVQKELYRYSLRDHRNYAREFLDYDICKIKEDCFLLNNRHKKTKISIKKGDVVTTRKISNMYLEVEYIDEEENIHNGYLKRDVLEFIEENK